MKETIVSMDALSKKTDITRDRTENLMGSSEQFRRGANKVRKQMWWKDMKMRVIIGIGIVVLIIIIVVPIVKA
jgi:vesicle-associated membrane protein 4